MYSGTFPQIARTQSLRHPFSDESYRSSDLLLAAEEDTIIPPAFAETLASLGAGASLLHVLAGANHVDIVRLSAHEIISRFLFELE